MKRPIISAALLAAAVAALFSAPAAASRRDRFEDHLYELNIRLDTDEHAIHGMLTIEYTNRSAADLADLRFHLYPNAFRDGGTVFMRESGGALRGIRAEDSGKIILHSLKVDGIDLLHLADDELIPGDRTQLSLPLDPPLPPETRATIVIEFTTELPTLFARSGHIDGFYIGAQFFPKLAKLSREGEWISFPYHGLGEFYADFASYELTLSTPHSMTVAANGIRGIDEIRDSRRIHRFLAERVHDLVFVASPELKCHTSRCHGVRVHLYYSLGAEPLARETEALTCFGLGHLGQHLFPYPYKDLSIILPPGRASGGAGMEYPGLFLTHAGVLPPLGLRFFGHAATTAHELAHQYFQGVIASDEVNHPLLDEGLASFFTYELLRAAYGRERSGSQRPPLDAFELLRLYQDERPSPATRPVFIYQDGAELYHAIYARIPLLLETIARTYGREKLLRAIGRYARRHRFAHPGPEDLYRVFEEVYSKTFVRSLLIPGLSRGAGARFHLGAPEIRGGLIHIEAFREGSLPIPSMVAAFYRDGRIRMEPFPPERDRMQLSFESDGLERIEIDPEHRNLLDRRRGDQRYLTDSRPSARLLRHLRTAFTLLGL